MGVFPKDDRPRFVDPPEWTKEAMDVWRERTGGAQFKDMMLGNWECSTAAYSREDIERMFGRGEISKCRAEELLRTNKTDRLLASQRKYIEKLNSIGIFPPCIMGDPDLMYECRHHFIDAKDMRGTPVLLCQDCGQYRPR